MKHFRTLAPEVPMGLLRDKLDTDPVSVVKELGGTAYNISDRSLVTRPEIVAGLHAAVVSVDVWTVNDPVFRQALADLGVDGIITDRPAELAGWNAARAANH
ncbi:glycerophosphodiester phosphodiesterase [Streptomyces sp. NPDC058486]|uniref:glycerophosphodiester phosphodiesterase n=1 Tax=unclassified Streptomyces TaxID=2593676 RepID=UPI003666AEC2